MSSSMRWIGLAVIVGLCTSYALWGLPRTPATPSAKPSPSATATAPKATPTTSVDPVVRVTKLQLDPEDVDFGTVPLNESRTAKQKLTNPTNKTIHIRDLRGSCGCVTVEAESTEIPPGESTTLKYRFAATAGKKGPITANFRTDEESNPWTAIALHAKVQLEIHIEPERLNFENVEKRTPKTLDFVVRSDDGKPFGIRSIAGSRQEYSFKWEPKEGANGSAYLVHATLNSSKGGTADDTAAVFTDRPRNGTMPLYITGSVTPDLVCDPKNVTADADSTTRMTQPFVTVMKRTTPGKLEITNVIEGNKPTGVPVSFDIERLTDESCKLTIRFKTEFPKRAAFGSFLIKTNVEEQDFALPYHVSLKSTPAAPKTP